MAAQTGATADKAEHLRALLRAGEFTTKEVELAAHLRFKPAMMVVGHNSREPIEVQNWASKLAAFGSTAMVRAAQAMAIKCLATGQGYCWGRWRRELRAIVDCGTRWAEYFYQREDAALQAAATARQIVADLDGTRMAGTSGSHLAFSLILAHGFMMESLGAEATPYDVTPLQLWKQEQSAPAWVHFAQMVMCAAWLADGSGRYGDWYTSQPCRSATLHTIGFLRSRLLTAEKWQAL